MSSSYYNARADIRRANGSSLPLMDVPTERDIVPHTEVEDLVFASSSLTFFEFQDELKSQIEGFAYYQGVEIANIEFSIFADYDGSLLIEYYWKGPETDEQFAERCKEIIEYNKHITEYNESLK